MDVASIATGLSQAQVSGSVDASVLKAVQNLAVDQVDRLFATLGLGTNVDTYA